MNLPNAYDRRDMAAAPAKFPQQTAAMEVVIVDPHVDRYADFVTAAMDGEIGLHFCNDAQSAVKLARRFRADVWLVSEDLPDMEGFDLLPLLAGQVSQGEVDPLLRGRRQSLGRVGQGRHSGIFIVADDYSIEGEQRALSAGIAGYLVRPVSAELVQSLRPAEAAPALLEGSAS
jgi:DNA-binding NarL/FixJ family response regulator